MPLLNTKIKKKLAPGKYQMHINDVKEFENDKGGYIQLKLQVGDREMLQNFFPTNITYLGRCLREQLGLPDDEDMDLVDILDQAQEADHLYAIVSYNDYGLNLAFHEPKTVENSDEVAF